MKRHWRRTTAFFGLVAIDLLSKLAAYTWLPHLRPPSDNAPFQLILTVNRGMGTEFQAMLATQREPEKMLKAEIFLPVLFALYLLIMSRVRQLTPVKVVLGLIGIAFVATIAGEWLTAHLIPSSLSIFAAVRLSIATLTIVLLRLVTAPWWRTAALLLAVAGISNTLSLFYPPYGIVDFMWWPSINRLIGLGVFNVADVAWYAAMAIAMMALLRSLVFFLRKEHQGSA